jgi:hypothetical protein
MALITNLVCAFENACNCSKGSVLEILIGWYAHSIYPEWRRYFLTVVKFVNVGLQPRELAKWKSIVLVITQALGANMTDAYILLKAAFQLIDIHRYNIWRVS